MSYKHAAYVTGPSLMTLVQQMSALKFGEPALKKQKKEGKKEKERKCAGVGRPMDAHDWTVMVRALFFFGCFFSHTQHTRAHTLTHFQHGFLGDSSWDAPITVTECEEEARPGYKSMKASEYFDTPVSRSPSFWLFSC